MDWWRKKKARSYEKEERSIRGRRRGAMLLEELIECCDGKSNPIKFFSPDQVLEATDNFSNSTYVFASLIYYGWCSGKKENHPMILIKEFTHEFNAYQLEELFCRDIAISSMVSGHKNFLKLVGCCLESEDVAMVFHAVKKHYNLELKAQTWRRRMKIAEDIAIALAYLHTAFPRPFVYANMKLENILLDEDGVAKLWDFSCCVSIPQGETFVKHKYKGHESPECIPTIIMYGFVDPNCLEKGVVSEKTDVYGIGILMQKLLSGERTFHQIVSFSSLALRIPNWLSSMEKRRMEEIADRETLEEMANPETLEGMDEILEDGLLSEEPRMEEIADSEMLEEMDEILEDGLLSEELRMEEIADSETLEEMDEILEDGLLSEEPRFRDLCYEGEGSFNRSYGCSIYSQNWSNSESTEEFADPKTMEEIADPKMIEEMGGISETDLRQMEDFLMLSQRCVGRSGQVPTMVEVAKELKKIQNSLET